MTTKMTGAEIVVRALEDEGIPFAFGIPGTHNIELYDVLGTAAGVRPILVTDEQSASFMADAVSRSSSRLGCVNLVPGAGLTHALSGIAEAFLDEIPMLVLSCGVRRDTDHAFQLHDVDQLAIARPVTKGQFRAETGADIYATIRRACRLARTPPGGPVIVEVPVDLYLFRHEADLTPPPDAPPPPGPTREETARAISLLAESRRPLLYLGLGAAAAGDRVVELAERLESPVSTTFQGKGVFPETHPLWLWPGFGPTAPPSLRKLAESCDLTLAIGCRFSEVGTGSYGLRPPGPLIHVDVDSAVVGRNYPAELGVTADAGSFVRELLADLPGRDPDPELRGHLAEAHRQILEAALRTDPDGPVAPGPLLRALQEAFGPEAIFTADSGNGTFLAIEGLRLDRPGAFLAPIDYSCMGYAVPGALGAALANPERPVVALAGDGAFLMTGLELLTASSLDVPVAVFVLRDRALAQIAQFQETAFARTTTAHLPDYDLAALCRGVGVEHLALDLNRDVKGALERAQAALAESRPVVVEVAIDYSRKTFFTRGVVRTNLGRLPWPDRLRFIARALGRRLTLRS